MKKHSKSIDVTRVNPRDVSYIKGNEEENDSVRLRFGAPDAIPCLEEKKDDVWNDAGLISALMSLGRDTLLSAVAGYLQTNNISSVLGHEKSLLPHVNYDDSGTYFAHTPVLDKLITLDIITTPVGEKVDTSITQLFTLDKARIMYRITLLTGSVAATEEVVMTMYAGTDATAPLFYRYVHPPASFPVSQEIILDINKDVGFGTDTPIFMVMTSAANFSLQTDVADDIISSFTCQEVEERDVIIDDLVIAEDAGLIFSNDGSLVFRNSFPL